MDSTLAASNSQGRAMKAVWALAAAAEKSLRAKAVRAAPYSGEPPSAPRARRNRVWTRWATFSASGAGRPVSNQAA